MDSADAGAGQHGHHRFGNHGHVDDDAVAFFDAEVHEDAAKLGDLVTKLAVGEGLAGIGDGAVVDEGGLVGTAVSHMHIQGVIAAVHFCPHKPTIKRRARIV